MRARLMFTLASFRAWPADPITVGFGQLPPLHYTDAHGRASGFIVDAVNEAARREGFEVAWTKVAGSQDIEPALAEHRIDIFPAAIITRARLDEYWVSEPWWTEDLSVLARSDRGTNGQRDWHGKRVLLASRPYLNIASTAMPGASFEILASPRSPRDLASSVPLLCTGEADAVLMPHSTLDEVLANRLQGCSGATFEIIETPHSLPLALIARPETRTVAECIYSRISEMARDGTLTIIAERYPRISARSAVMLAETLRLRYERRSLWTAMIGTLLVAILAGALLMRQLRIQNAPSAGDKKAN